MHRGPHREEAEGDSMVVLKHMRACVYIHNYFFVCVCVCVRACVRACPQSYLLSTDLMQIPESWVNPTGQWRVGAKALYQLFPAELIQRLNVSQCIHLGGVRMGCGWSQNGMWVESEWDVGGVRMGCG